MGETGGTCRAHGIDEKQRIKFLLKTCRENTTPKKDLGLHEDNIVMDFWETRVLGCEFDPCVSGSDR